MRYFALATDYDGTLATDGRVADATIAALERLKASGRRVVLVTGRRLDDLQRAFARTDLFDRIVAENGAVVFDPLNKELRVLEAAPPAAFVDALRARGVEPLDVGHVIVATWGAQEGVVVETIRTMGLELHVEFNKGAVMILPAGVTKRTGLAAALDELQLSAHNVVGIGDAENDHTFISACELAVSVQNALPSLKERSDWVTSASEGAGVTELIDRILQDDLASLTSTSERRALFVGREAGGQALTLDVYASNLLVAGPSGSGKTTLATALVERLLELGYQLCVIDPEGDHEKLAPLAGVGSAEHPPTVDEVEALLAEPHHSAVATLLAIPMDDRPRWFGALLGRIEEQRFRSGRPHCLVVDEAHHVMPASGDTALETVPRRTGGVMLVTVNPQSLSRIALDSVNFVLTTPQGAASSLRAFADATGRPAPTMPAPVIARPDDHLDAVAWRVGDAHAVAVSVPPPRHQHLRHKRKYARGDLGEDRSFFFRGPTGALNLRAQNLALFAQIARGVDDATWLYHLRAGDYSRWFREAIKDPALADEAAGIEQSADMVADESRAKIRAAIDKRYTLPE